MLTGSLVLEDTEDLTNINHPFNSLKSLKSNPTKAALSSRTV